MILITEKDAEIIIRSLALSLQHNFKQRNKISFCSHPLSDEEYKNKQHELADLLYRLKYKPCKEKREKCK